MTVFVSSSQGFMVSCFLMADSKHELAEFLKTLHRPKAPLAGIGAFRFRSKKDAYCVLLGTSEWSTNAVDSGAVFIHGGVGIRKFTRRVRCARRDV